MTYTVVFAGGLVQAAVDRRGPWALLVTFGVLAAVEVFAHRFEVRPVVLLLARVAAFALIAVAEPSGLWRALLILVPFTAWFALGRTVAVMLAAGTFGMILVALTIQDVRWFADAEQLGDLLMFLLGEVIALAMAAVAVREREVRRRLQDTMAELREHAATIAELSTVRERNRLAREMHDSLGHHLTAIGVQIQKAQAYRDRDPVTADRALADARWSADRALAEARDSVRTLRADDAPFSLVTSLRELVRRAGGDSLAVEFTVSGEERLLTSEVRTALYRAAQEGLTNVRRHASARRACVRLSLDGPSVEVEVTDDGVGIRSGGEGFGLTGLRERCALLGGELDVSRGAAGHGTILRMTLPATEMAPA
ncbi:sensor histidine kinase [Nocardia sp. NPDC056064]|uniref:sensor histidine kinase n=1 Tax=Nocardia sp. NPDC056064 TaxID=3345701 RepID=UPI0035DE3E6D